MNFDVLTIAKTLPTTPAVREPEEVVTRRVAIAVVLKSFKIDIWRWRTFKVSPFLYTSTNRACFSCSHLWANFQFTWLNFIKFILNRHFKYQNTKVDLDPRLNRICIKMFEYLNKILEVLDLLRTSLLIFITVNIHLSLSLQKGIRFQYISFTHYSIHKITYYASL